MEEKKELKVINVIDIAKKLWARKKLFAKTLPIAFVVSVIFILGFPRYYGTDIKLAPELGGTTMNSTLGSLASSFGFDLDNLQNNDAITPLLYPNLMEDNGFVASLMNIKVENQDHDIKATYHDYLKTHQKYSWWTYPVNWVKNLLPKKEEKTGNKGSYDPYFLSKSEDGLLGKARDNINISIDKKTGVITISVEDQDPLICKTMADSVKSKLQVFITDYRTNKARVDYEYYKKLSIEAKQDYERMRQRYGAFVDGNVNIAMQSVRLKAEEMESEMELRFNNYTTINNQLQAAKAKVQERTPAFTVIKGANVPVKPSGPKRMAFVAFILLLTFAGTSIYILSRQ